MKKLFFLIMFLPVCLSAANAPAAGTITLISPSGVELWQAGSYESISWISQDVENVSISYSTNNGLNWSTVDPSIPASQGSYLWTVPGTVSSQYQIRISDAANDSVSFVSNSFSVFAAPTAATSPATNITVNSAVLNGLVNANNAEAEVSFDYGTSRTYGSNANAVQSPVNGMTDTDVSANVTGLTQGVTYHFRVKAVNTAGTVLGPDQTFTTDKTELRLTAPVGGEQWRSGINYNITWTSKKVDNVEIAYSTDNLANWVTIVSSTPASQGSYSWTVPGFLASTYRIRISDASDASLVSTSNTFSVYSLPSAATNAATGITVNSAVLNGTASAGNSTATVTFEYGTTTSYGATVDASPGSVDGLTQTNVSASISGLTPGVTYHYRVNAVNNAGGVNGSDRSFTTEAITLSLTSPTGGERWLAGSTYSITWISNNVSDAALAYSTDSGGSWTTITNGTPASTSTYNWKVPQGVSSQYRIRVSDASNPLLSSSSGSFSVYSLPAVVTDNAADITVNSAVLNASVNANNSSTDLTFEYGTSTSYGRTAKPTQNPVSGIQPISVSASVTGLKAATTYHFRIKAVNEAGTVYGDDKTFAADSIYLALSSPNGGEEWPAGSGHNITWTSKNVGAIMILYSMDGGISWITMADATPASTGSYSWTVPDSLSSQYKIRIIDAENVLFSSTSNVFSVFSAPEVLTSAASDITINSAVIRGTAKAGNTSTDVVFNYGTTTIYGSNIKAQQSPIKGTAKLNISAELTGLRPATTYHYRIMATNSAGTQSGRDTTFTTDSIKLALFAPAGGEKWKAGTINPIIWSGKNLTNVKIDYSTDDGKNWITISANTPASGGIYSWTVPDTPSSKYRIKVSSSSDTLLSYTSKPFSVYSIPVVVTNEASNITLSSAVLYASVNAGNSDAKVTFEYGTSTAYGLNTPAVPDTVGGTITTIVSAAISGLSQSNSYHFRIKAENTAGKVYGDDKTFTTDGIALTLTYPDGSVRWQSGTIQNITWRSKNVANIVIGYSTDGGTNWATITTGVSTSKGSYAWTVPGQASSKYRIRISDALNPVLNSISDMFSVYSAPSVLTSPAADITISSATLKGTVNAGNSTTIASFEYGMTVSYGSAVNVSQNPLSGTANTEVSAAVSGLTQGATYHYRLKAVNEAGPVYGSDMTFTVLSPELKLISPSAGEEITGSFQYTITWTSSDVSQINIEYSTDNGISWLNVASGIMASQGSYLWTVPNNINSGSCKLRITDKSNSTVSDTVNGIFKITMYAQSIDLSGKVFTFTSPYQQSSYRMISLPGESSQLKLSGFVQGVANKDWTMYYDNGLSTNYYVQYDGSSDFNFAPGKGFWILSKNAVNLTGTIKTVTLSSDGTYSIHLDHGGWNIISSPFDISIAWTGVQALNNVTEKISSWSGSKFDFSQNMNAYEGYYFYNTRNLNALKLPYKAVLQKAGSQRASPAKSGFSEAVFSPQSENSITISLIDGDEVKSCLTMGWNKNSSDDYDSLDVMAPPGDFEEAGMRIINSGLSTGWKQLFTEYRNSISEGLKFTVTVKNNTGRSMRLNCEGMDNLKGYEVYLLDKRLSRPHDLRKETEITLPSYAKLSECELLIGSSTFIEEESLKLMPQEFSLFQNYPNPFNPSTQIKYSLPKDAFVTIRVYDVLGREVRLLVSGFNEAGYHEASFDAGGISSGVYYYIMEAKGPEGRLQYRASKKMVLVK